MPRRPCCRPPSQPRSWAAPLPAVAAGWVGGGGGAHRSLASCPPGRFKPPPEPGASRMVASSPCMSADIAVRVMKCATARSVLSTSTHPPTHPSQNYKDAERRRQADEEGASIAAGGTGAAGGSGNPAELARLRKALREQEQVGGEGKRAVPWKGKRMAPWLKACSCWMTAVRSSSKSAHSVGASKRQHKCRRACVLE